MKLRTYATVERSPNASEAYSIRLRRVRRGDLIETLTPGEARKLARHLLAIARAAENANGKAGAS